MSKLIRLKTLTSGKKAWYSNFGIEGKRICRASPFPNDKTKSILWARKLKEDELIKVRDPNYIESTRFGVALESYALEKTISNHHKDLLLTAFKHFNLDQITPRAVHQRITEPGLRDQIKPQTINRRITVLQAILNYAHSRLGLLPHRVTFEKLTVIDGEKHYALTHEKFAELHRNLIHYLKDPALFTARHGLRRNNIHQFRIHWINHNDRSFTIPAWNSKSRKPMTFDLSDEMYDLLIRNIQIDPSCEYVFKNPNVRKATKKHGMLGDYRKPWTMAREACGLMNIPGHGNFRWHDLRHTFGQWVYDETKDIYEASKLLGHSKIDMTLRYAKNSASHRDIGSVLERKLSLIKA